MDLVPVVLVHRRLRALSRRVRQLLVLRVVVVRPRPEVLPVLREYNAQYWSNTAQNSLSDLIKTVPQTSLNAQYAARPQVLLLAKDGARPEEAGAGNRRGGGRGGTGRATKKAMGCCDESV